MEIWFVFAVVSIFTAGIESFTHKIAAMRKYDIALMNFIGGVFSTLLLLGVVLYTEGFSYIWTFSSLMVAIGALVYFLTLILKVEALKLIDTTIFFPIYKVTGPLIAILIGMLFFGERFSALEWVGLLLSMFVPLMLITRSEKSRQKNLVRGLVIALLGAVVASISIAFHKYGIDLSVNVWTATFVAQAVAIVSSLIFLMQKHRRNLYTAVQTEATTPLIGLGVCLGVLSAGSGLAMFFSFSYGGALGIVYSISSIYILIPIVLSIIFYKEHWSLRKAVAIALSIAALALLH